VQLSRDFFSFEQFNLPAYALYTGTDNEHSPASDVRQLIMLRAQGMTAIDRGGNKPRCVTNEYRDGLVTSSEQRITKRHCS